MKNKKFRNRMIAVIMVICFITNIVYFTIRNSQDAYAVGAAVVAGAALTVDADLVLTLLCAGLATAGIYTAVTDGIDNYNDLSADEKATVNSDYTVSQKEILQMLYDQGYFEGMDCEELVYSALNNIEGSSAIDMYKSKTGLADNQLKVIKGSGSNNDDDSSSSLAATAGLLAIGKDAILNIAKEIKQAFQKFVEDNKNNMISVSEYPFDSLPVSDRYPYYLCYQKTDGTYYCYAYKADSTSGDLSTIPSLYDSTSCTLNVYLNTGSFPDSYYYYLSSGYLVCNLYKWDSANETWVYDSFTRRPIFNYAYVGYGRWDILYSSVNLYNNIRNETFEQKLFESSANVDVAVQDVNDYLDNLGLKTRVTENLLNDVEPDNIFENVTTSLPYGGTYNGIVLDPSSFPDILPAISAAQSAAANGTGTDTDTNSDVTAAAAAAAENTPLSTPDIDPDTEETLSGEPTSSFGNINLYKTDGLLDKFPFCIPADIFRCVAVLSADPVAPYWEFPFKFERWGIDETIVLDMSKFDSVAAISRWVETLCFIYILANKTKQYMFV